jgi:hypothetical protein
LAIPSFTDVDKGREMSMPKTSAPNAAPVGWIQSSSTSSAVVAMVGIPDDSNALMLSRAKRRGK